MSSAFALLFLAAPIPQSTWYVDAAVPGPGQGTLQDPYARIDHALAQPATVAGDTVLVAPGLYADEMIDFLGKDVVVRSQAGAAETTIQAPQNPMVQSAAVRFTGQETAAAVLDGFTVIGGYGEMGPAPLPAGAPAAGGIYCSNASPTLLDLVFRAGPEGMFYGTGAFLYQSSSSLSGCSFEGLGEDFSSSFGGGLAAVDSDLVISDCEFRMNKAATLGGAAYFEDSSAQITDCVFHENRMAYAGGPAIGSENSELEIRDCSFVDNAGNWAGGAIYASVGDLDVMDCSFAGNNSGIDNYWGGAIYGRDLTANVSGCEFRFNTGSRGGAIAFQGQGTATVESCVFESNTAYGGQVGSGAGALEGASVVRNSIFVSNSADDSFTDGGGAIGSAGLVENCTFVGNVSRPDFADTIRSASVVVNCILIGTSADVIGAATSVRYSNVLGGLPAGAALEGNISADPQFWGAPDDLGLLANSPCIDTGDPAILDADGTRSDMGAIAFDPFRCEAGCAGALGVQTCTANVNSVGAPASLAAFGSSVAQDDRVTFTVTDVPVQHFGFFLLSESSGSAPLGGGSQGLLCLGGAVRRLSNDVLTTRGTGVVAYRPQLGSVAPGFSIGAGETWFFQYWFRDANPGPTSNTSSAVRIDFQ
ncbi:MAG: right-handed parallel beta-helix repeat-containing protein [Planctomycetota bacterium]